MTRAIGFVEFLSIATGLEAADALLKTADVTMTMGTSLCPGKFIVLFDGDVSAVESARSAAVKLGGEWVFDDLVLANVHPDVFPATAGSALQVPQKRALGAIETFSAAAAILAADAAAKAAPVKLIEVRLLRGLEGRAFVVLTGDVSSVRSAVESGLAVARTSGHVVGSTVVPRPDARLWSSFA